MNRRLTRRTILLACAAGAVAIGVAAGVGARGNDGPTPGVDAPDGKAQVIAAIDEQMAKDRAKAAGKERGGKPANPQSLRPSPQPDPRSGEPRIVPVSSPFPASQYLLDGTGWAQPEGSRVELVYAGALADDPTQGIVVVVHAKRPSDNPSPDQTDQGLSMTSKVVRTPAKVGPVEIESAAGHMLTIVTSDRSRKFRFDAAAEKFVAG